MVFTKHLLNVLTGMGMMDPERIFPEIASVAMLLRNDWIPCSVFASEAVPHAAPLNVAILMIREIPTSCTIPRELGHMVSLVESGIISDCKMLHKMMSVILFFGIMASLGVRRMNSLWVLSNVHHLRQRKKST